jgi:ATP-GRASP peptide maturase of grasp-with-spasm system
MILILSVTSDLTTDSVCDWLYINKKVFTRLNLDIEKITNINFSFDSGINLILKFNSNRVINFKEVDSVWYRRGEFVFEKNFEVNNVFNNSVSRIVKKEIEICIKFIYKCISNSPKPKIGNILREIENNKLDQLAIASQLGLKIPKTIISTSKVNQHLLNSRKLITKPIYNTFDLSYNSKHSYISVQPFDSHNNEKLGENTFPYLVQERLNKKYEIRSFVLFDEIYSMAIFSQNNEKTSLDFRNYDKSSQNRMVRYRLPNTVEDKIRLLMKKLEIESGSIDLVYTQSGEYVFLEVNHIGQFGWLSYYCNYYLDKMVSNNL